MIMEWLKETSVGAISLGLKVAAIVVCLTLFQEFVKSILPSEGRRHSSRILTMAAGLFLGLVYGAGVIIKSGRDGSLKARELFLIALFLSTCHAVIEDTLLFVAVGGSFLWILGTRLVAASLVTLMAAFLLRLRNEKV